VGQLSCGLDRDAKRNSGRATFFGAVTIQAQSAESPDKAPPSYDPKPLALQDLQTMQQHFADLADAIPAGKFTWRPGEGVRSFSEVFLHITTLNFSLAPNFGAAPAPGFTQQGYEKSTTDKAKIVGIINQSFEYVRAALEKRSTRSCRRSSNSSGRKPAKAMWSTC
jgi:hypothetical protein